MSVKPKTTLLPRPYDDNLTAVDQIHRIHFQDVQISGHFCLHNTVLVYIIMSRTCRDSVEVVSDGSVTAVTILSLNFLCTPLRRACTGFCFSHVEI